MSPVNRTSLTPCSRACSCTIRPPMSTYCPGAARRARTAAQSLEVPDDRVGVGRSRTPRAAGRARRRVGSPPGSGPGSRAATPAKLPAGSAVGACRTRRWVGARHPGARVARRDARVPLCQTRVDGHNQLLIGVLVGCHAHEDCSAPPRPVSPVRLAGPSHVAGTCRLGAQCQPYGSGLGWRDPHPLRGY